MLDEEIKKIIMNDYEINKIIPICYQIVMLNAIERIFSEMEVTMYYVPKSDE